MQRPSFTGLKLKEILPIMVGKVIFIENGQKVLFSSRDEVPAKYAGDYIVVNVISIEDDTILIELENIEDAVKKRIKEKNYSFIQGHETLYGVEPNLFDGA